MIRVNIDLIPMVSYALVQNKVAIIRNITVKNDSDTNYENLTVKVSFDPEFADTLVEHIVSLPAGEYWKATDMHPAINSSYICNITEKVTAKTTVQVIGKNTDVEGENGILAHVTKEVDILDYCQYWGNSFMSQYLAAFVTPRHIALDPIISRASQILEKWTGNCSLSAYLQDVPNRPKKIVGALYEAISEQNITFCYPTMTLAKHGQKIRTCEELLSEERGKRGCCLDMALLMCSCLEAVGLHPLLIMQDDHAFAGCWLINDMFADSVNDDPTVITKRTAEGINEVILVETTGANEGCRLSFDQAVSAANEKIKNINKFEYVLDVSHARLAGVQPIPQRIYNGHEYEVVNPDPVNGPHGTPEDLGEIYTFRKDRNELNRFDLWERRLLDLSTRNNLLNIHFTRNTLRIMVSSLTELVKPLYANKEINIIERPEDWGTATASKDLGERISDDDPIHDLLRKEVESNRLRSYQKNETLTKTLTNLYRTSRLTLEESGANTLFIALGFLKWFEPGRNMPFFAPIILYPIRLERKSANKGYYMTSREEDPFLNETLFEFLKQNYSIEIPDVTSALQNENGVDTRYILAAVRKAIMEQENWDVIEEATISIFEFNRFVIWNDLKYNRQRIQAHPLVSSLVDGKLHEGIADGADTLKEETRSKDVALPISADSSQLAAIIDSAADKSFVLHGPPGTGKSQTITNIIANALFHGKRVLFVAEKMAALEVVQKRLAAIGLAPFCLELHSNKTKKSLVMEQLRKTTEVMQSAADNAFADEAEHLDELKRELDGHVEHLHRVHPCGWSIYDCLAMYSAIGVGKVVNIDENYIKVLTPQKYREHEETIESFMSVAEIITGQGNSLKGIGLTEYSPKLRNQITGCINNTVQDIRDFTGTISPLSGVIGNGMCSFTRKQHQAMYDIATTLHGNEIPTSLIVGFESSMLSALEELAALREELETAKCGLQDKYQDKIFETEYEGWRRMWLNAENKWFLMRHIDRNSVIKKFSSLTKGGRQIDKTEIMPLFETLDCIHNLQKRYNETVELTFNSYETRRELAKANASCLNSYKAGLSRLLTAFTSLELTVQSVSGMYMAGYDSFMAKHGKTLERYIAAYDRFNNSLTALEALTCASLDYLSLAKLNETLSLWSANIENLRSKVAYNNIRAQVCDSGLATVVESFEKGDIEFNHIADIYNKSLFKHCADYYISLDDGLSFFQSILFEEKIQRFRKLCNKFEELTQKELRTRMAAMLPALHKEAAQSSDVGYLQKCIRNGCRGVSIRKLFDTIPDLISRMCPAMLMSPLSVSQYLSQEWPQFDLVVFDEASQMPTCEAIAAISRGKSAIIVGDEHQLPPTSFFVADNFSEQHSESEDLESILEDCLAMSMPQKHLLWHYRSRHESLITFSNRHFYKNSLLTFPSNDDMATKVSLEFVNGVYERGSGRHNKEEAKAVLKEIEHLLLTDSGKSIGVVTFNVNQQSLIEDMLNDMLRKNPKLEVAAANLHEPIFIKNLENVQGDERDVILFSVGYGRDKSGKVAMNFGPLNRNGGERRLNVAVSRARCSMKVFSSLRPDEIDLYRSNAKGVQYLRSFLEYAERGKSALMNLEYAQKRKEKDALVESVATALRERGYMINTDVGSSEYRIDIGIIDPKNPECYLLGLLCDGYNYTVSTTAHDRNVTTPAVLSQLGWRTYNIWSIEWWDTPRHVLDCITREIERTVSMQEEEPVIIEKPLVEETEEPVEIVQETKEDAQEYVSAVLKKRSGDSALFSQGEYTRTVIKDIETILDVEAPISRRLLIKKLLGNYNISRNGNRINAYLAELFTKMKLVTSGKDDIFFWKDREQFDNYRGFRTASGREALDIAPEEVAQAAIKVLKEQFAINEEGLIAETAHLLGYASVRDNVLTSMKRGIEYAVNSRKIVLDGERYRLP